MNEQKQIEEMAEIIKKQWVIPPIGIEEVPVSQSMEDGSFETAQREYEVNALEIAAALHNAGYRKQNNEAVLEYLED